MAELRSATRPDGTGPRHPLVVSPNTVKTQTHSIYRELGVRSREDAVRIARERRLIDNGEVGVTHG